MVWSTILPFRTVDERGGVTLFVHVTKLMCWMATICTGILGADMLWVCAEHIDCHTVLPTLSYMASFRPNDRFATLAVCLYALSLPCFYLLTNASVASSANVWDLRVMSLSALTLSLAVPFTQIFDEANLTHFGPTEKMHLIMVIGVVGLGAIWTYLFLLSVWRRPKSSLRTMDRHSLCVLIYIAVTAGAGIIAFLQWYTPKEDDWASKVVEPVSEYLAVVLALYSPAVLTVLCPRKEIEVATMPVEKQGGK